MLRSMFAGVAGLRSHQVMMDVVGNNIANVNTAGYKSSSVVFQDLLSQVVKGASPGTDEAGGTNPAQVGLGVKMASVATNFSQGAAQLTGRSLDVSISGDGFFVARQAGENLYTRLGSLSLDSAGQLVTPDGGKLQGWLAQNGTINANTAPVNLVMPVGQSLAPTATGNTIVGGNLPADMTSAPIGTVITTSVSAFDAQGIEIPITFEFTKTAADTWELQALGSGTPPAAMWGAPQAVQFDAAGALTTPTGPASYDLTAADLNNGGYANAGPITVDLAQLTQFGSQKTVNVESQDGYAMGFLQSFSIAQDGTINGVFSNGLSRALGQLAVATFANPVGLEKTGGSSYRSTVNSGLPNVGPGGTGGRGTMSSGTLEMSNVDLAAEFTNLIVAQRGFQANSRVITASDELLQDLVNLKR